jgi:hypothetical protein
MTTAIMTPGQVEPEVTENNPELVGGIPWLWVLGGVIVIGALIVVAFFAWRKENEQD